MFPNRNGLTQGDDMSPLIFNFALVYATRRAQVNQDGLKLMVHTSFWFMLMMIMYLAKVYILLKKNTEALLVGSKEIGLEVHGHVLRSECRMKSQYED